MKLTNPRRQDYITSLTGIATWGQHQSGWPTLKINQQAKEMSAFTNDNLFTHILFRHQIQLRVYSILWEGSCKLVVEVNNDKTMTRILLK